MTKLNSQSWLGTIQTSNLEDKTNSWSWGRHFVDMGQWQLLGVFWFWRWWFGGWTKERFDYDKQNLCATVSIHAKHRKLDIDAFSCKEVTRVSSRLFSLLLSSRKYRSMAAHSTRPKTVFTIRLWNIRFLTRTDSYPLRNYMSLFFL